MKDYLIRLVQVHESFRKAEVLALAALAELNIKIIAYSNSSPFCIIQLENEAAARALIRRAIISHGIYELWGSGSTYEELHAVVRSTTKSMWAQYRECTFRFQVDAYRGKCSSSQQKALIESFGYLGFDGPILMKGFEQEFCIFEDYDFKAKSPKQVHFGRWIAGGDREAITTYDLKKRRYISTTSMDAELALVTANLTLAAPGKLFYDPFVGTGSFSVACSHFGATSLGSDIDPRSIKGTAKKNLFSNFVQYGLVDRFLDSFVSDLTHTPVRGTRLFDGIICDPPYGVREGLKVLGNKDGKGKEPIFVDGKPAHLLEHYIPPKRPYSFEAMLDDILEFAALTLVENGRVSLWMPTANDEDVELGIPTHPSLEVVSVCVQAFNKWSRRLLTYRRMADSEIVNPEPRPEKKGPTGTTANDLNSFRRRYFEGFKAPANSRTEPDIAAVIPSDHQ
ncbi:MAG: hypothetical protein M1819_000258 [Sarea resinae]|nr:MAG: hypothetical protein M1819_000258 [Sarea resinae]